MVTTQRHISYPSVDVEWLVWNHKLNSAIMWLHACKCCPCLVRTQQSKHFDACEGFGFSKQGQQCSLYETGDKNTHRSFRGSEPGICRTAVLWQDCIGSAFKDEKSEVNLRVCNVFMMTVRNRKQHWQLFSTRKKRSLSHNLQFQKENPVYGAVQWTHTPLVWLFIPDCFDTHAWLLSPFT